MIFLPGVYNSFAKSYHGFIAYMVLLGCTMVLLGFQRIHLDLPGFCGGSALLGFTVPGFPSNFILSFLSDLIFCRI